MRRRSVVSLIRINYTDGKIEQQHLLTQFYQEHFRSMTAKFFIYTASGYLFPFVFATNP